MTIQQLLEVILRKEDSEIKNLCSQLGTYLESKQPKYKIVEIVTTYGNMAHKIEQDTGFESFHKYPVQEYTSGTKIKRQI